jgi:uncharacterized protein YbjT (DUF2867 family)
MKALVAGATGFIGRELVPALLEDGHEVVSLARNPERAADLKAAGSRVAKVDLMRRTGLRRAMQDVDVAYFLVHMMSGADYAESESAAAKRFAEAATEAGVERVIYLGGLGDPEASPHLLSRHRTAEVLRELGPPLTYFRSSMVIGSDSESFRLLRAITERTPAVPDKDWIRHRTQPIGLRDVIRYLTLAPSIAASAGREIQIGAPEALTHLDLIDLMARELGRRPRRRWRVFGARPGAVAAAAAIVTKGSGAVASELTLSLATDSVVTDPAPAREFPFTPEPIHVAIQRAIEDDEAKAA